MEKRRKKASNKETGKYERIKETAGILKKSLRGNITLLGEKTLLKIGENRL